MEDVLTPESEAELVLPPILAAALDALQLHGYHGTTVRDIARRADLTMPSLYYHYGNKEGILFALLDIGMDELIRRVNRALDAATDDPADRLAWFVRATVSYVTSRNDLALLHSEFRFLGPEYRERYLAKRAWVDDTLVDLLTHGQDAPFHISDVKVTTRAIMGMISGIGDWYDSKGPSSPEEIAEEYVQAARRLVGIPEH